MRYLIMFVMLASCTPGDNTICNSSQEVQTGEYDMQTSEAFGDCGSMGSLTVSIDSGIVLLDEGVGCVLESSSWESDTCSTHSSFVCDDGTWKMNLIWEVSTEGADQSLLSGKLSADMSKWGGIYTCYSEYDFTAVRVEDIAE